MAKTFAEVDTKRSSINNESNAQSKDVRRQREELRQRNKGNLALLIAPIAVATVASVAFLTVRRLSSNERNNKRRK